MANKLQALARFKEEELEKEECNKEIEDTYEAANKDQAEYDKQLIALSGAFLAVTLAFIKDVVRIETAICRGLLYTSFVLLAFCVTAVLFSFQFSIYGHAKARKYWHAKRDRVSTASFPYRHAWWVGIINMASGVIFAIGVMCAIFFVIINIHHEAKFSPQRKEEKVMATKNPDSGKRGQNMKDEPAPKPSQPTQQPKKTK